MEKEIDIKKVTEKLIDPDQKYTSIYMYTNSINFLNCMARIFVKKRDTAMIRHFVVAYEEEKGLHLCRVGKYFEPIQYEGIILFAEIREIKISSIPLGYRLEIITKGEDGQKRKYILTTPQSMEGIPEHKTNVLKILSFLKEFQKKLPSGTFRKLH